MSDKLQEIKEYVQYRKVNPNHAINLLQQDKRYLDWLAWLIEQLEQGRC